MDKNANESTIRIIASIKDIERKDQWAHNENSITKDQMLSIRHARDSIAELQGKTYDYLPSGFSDISTCTLSFDYTGTGSKPKIFLTGTHYFYILGERYAFGTMVLDTGSVVSATGMYYVYYNSTPALVISSIWPGFDDVALVATIYWNSVTAKALVADERHGMQMPGIVHEYLHNTVGVRYGSGLNGTFGNSTFSITDGNIYDEDLKFDISEQTSCDILYKDGSSDYKWLINRTDYYYTSGGNVYYNNGNTLTAMDANKYVAYWIFATTSVDRSIVSLMGQRQDVTLADARANNKYESLSLGALPFKEMKLLYRVILRNDVTPYEETQDLRSVSNLPAGTYLATDHGVLSGLTDDDHSQYMLSEASSTDNAIVRWDSTTGREIQDSGAKVLDTTGSVVTSGGVHVGAESDPGADNLQVDGWQKTTDYGVFVGGLKVGSDEDVGTNNFEVDGTSLFNGLATFKNNIPVIDSALHPPTTDYQLADKKYVDDLTINRNKNLWIAGWKPTKTSGCGDAAQLEMGTNKNVIDYLPFDAASIEYAYQNVPMPLDYDGGTITAKFIWTHPTTTTNFKVSWGLQGVATGDDDTLDVAQGTAVYANDEGGTASDNYTSPATSAITIAGTPAAGKLINFRVLRKADDGTNDTLAVDAYLIGVLIEYGIS